MENQPTVEQSLHSIALSLIGIHKELKDTRRVHKETLRHSKQQVDVVFNSTSGKRSWRDRLRDLMRGPIPL